MILQVTRVPEEGLEFDFTEKDGWVREKLSWALKEHYHPEDPVLGHFSVYRTLDNLSVKLKATLTVHAVCSRCLKEYQNILKINSDRLFSPLYESKRQRAIEKALDVELTQDDINFSYYEGDEIDLGDMLAELALLGQPLVELCKKKCKGLCSHCGMDLNFQTCTCQEKSLKESPFAALKKLIKD